MERQRSGCMQDVSDASSALGDGVQEWGHAPPQSPEQEGGIAHDRQAQPFGVVRLSRAYEVHPSLRSVKNRNCNLVQLAARP